MSPRDSQLSRCSPIGCQSIGADAFWTDTGVLQKLPEQTHRSLGIATFLDEDVEDFAFVVDCPPEPHSLSGDFHDHLVQVPAAGRLGSGSAKVLSKKPAEFERPASNGFVVCLDPPFGQHLLDVAQAQGGSGNTAKRPAGSRQAGTGAV